MMRIFLFVILFFQSVNILYAQDINIDKALKQAQKKTVQKKYNEAIVLLDQIIKQGSSNAAAHYTLGEIHLKIRDYVAAKKDFLLASKNDKLNFPLAQYYYALMLKMNSEYADAKSVFKDFIQQYKTIDNFSAWAKVEIAGCDTALSENANNYNEGLKIKHLPATINSRYSEMGPMFWDESTLLYASLPKDSFLLFTGDTAMDYHIKFFLADFANDSFFKPQRINDFMVPYASVANGSLIPNKTKFYFTACIDQQYDASVICQIYMSRFQYGKWNEPERLETPLNDMRYNNSHPSIVPFKKDKFLLYFSSDRPNGKGGKDIWFAFIDENNKVSEPQNAGSINTTRDDITPYYDDVNGHLYFSSEGHAGFGGLDVYKATGERNNWSEITNMKQPINSSVDDLYFSFDAKKNRGLLVSNRSDKNVSGGTCCDDIFYVKYEKPKKLAILGKVFEADEKVNFQLENLRVSLSEIDSSDKSFLLKEKITNGNEPFYFLLKPDKNYSLAIIKEGYFNKTIMFNTLGKAAPDSIFVKVLLDKIQPEKTYRLSSIYYNYNDFALLPEAKLTLDTLFDILIENPEIKMELSSHTDSKGSEDYNLQLSQKRAQSCVNYLIAKGINMNRLFAKGYGASKPLQDCSLLPECTTAQDCPCFQLNRRTAFKVLRGE